MKVRVSTVWRVEACSVFLFSEGALLCTEQRQAPLALRSYTLVRSRRMWWEKLGHLLSQPSPPTGHGWSRSVKPANPWHSRIGKGRSRDGRMGR